ncbi:MAG TPA: HAD hydrolase-like protein [Bacillales bacterium]|nr:HAD hydrolase-like protein [Bacillales bacterium]
MFEEETELAFEAVILELEGVIAETAPYEIQAWKHTAGEYGVFDENWEDRWKRLGEDRLMEWIQEKSHMSESALGKDDMLAKKEAYYDKLIHHVSPKDLSPGMVPLLTELKKNGVRIAAASTKRNARPALEQLDVGDFFNEVIDELAVGSNQSLAGQILSAIKALDTSYEKSVVAVNLKNVTPENKTGLFLIGVGSSQPVEGTNWTVDGTAELIYEDLKEKYLEDR